MSRPSLRLLFLLSASLSACSHSNGGISPGDVDMAGTSGSNPDFAELNTPPTCTSGTMWTQGDRGSSRMHPGDECIACHDANGGPFLSIAGTVFPSAHEPTDCNGASSIQVVITGADGASFTLTTNSAGNFYSTRSFATPFSAKVVSGTKERAMLATQTSGDCNGCHTQDGTMDAPGRIVAP